MATNKKPKAKKPKALLDAEKKIAELEKDLKGANSSKDTFYKLYTEEKAITDGLHDILDDMGIRGFRDENKYQRIPLTVRLFAWAMTAHIKQ